MKRVGIALGAVLILHALATIVASFILPQAIAAAEENDFAVRVAIARLTRDRRVATDRIRAVKDLVRERKLSRIAEALLILGDEDLNRLASDYLGGDWTERESEFLKRVIQSRRRLFRQKKMADDGRRAFDRKVRELEQWKNMLSHGLHSPYGDSYREKRRRTIEQRLEQLGKTQEGAFSDRSGNGGESSADACVKNEQVLAGLAAEQEESTVGALLKCLTEKLVPLQWRERELAYLRRAETIFSIWPFYRRAARHKESEREERL